MICGRRFFRVLVTGSVLAAAPVTAPAHGNFDSRRAPVVYPGQVLQFDRTYPGGTGLRFERGTRDLQPEIGTFSLIEFRPMSNDIGERWALVSVENSSHGERFLKNRHLVATFADGRQAYARNLNDRVGGGELLSKAVFFGHSPFPLVRVEARHR